MCITHSHRNFTYNNLAKGISSIVFFKYSIPVTNIYSLMKNTSDIKYVWLFSSLFLNKLSFEILCLN